MELKKRLEEITNDYSSGEKVTKVNHVQYAILRDGSEIGSADVWEYNMSLNLNTGNLNDNESLLKSMINAANE